MPRVRTLKLAAFSAVAVVLAAGVGLYLYATDDSQPPLYNADLDRKCAIRPTEDLCHGFPLFRKTTYDVGACHWTADRCRFQPDIPP